MRERDPHADPFAEGWLSYASGAGNPYDAASAEPEEREDAEEWEAGRHSAAAFHGQTPAAAI